MPQITRSRDHSIWFKHIDDSQGDLLATLRQLAPGQFVVMRVANREGLWRRFQRGKNGAIPEALTCADDRARAIWAAIPQDGLSVDITLVEVVSFDSTLPTLQPSRRPTTRRSGDKKALPGFVPAAGRLEGDVLCLGIDIAWWGGHAGTRNKHTRSECIAIAARRAGTWGDMEIHRVDLTSRDCPDADDFTANADVEAELLVNAVGNVLSHFGDIPYVVLAGDVPMLAQDRPELPRPTKPKQSSTGIESKTTAYRACDRQWHIERRKSPRGWSNIQILPGAPLYPRIVKLVAKLLSLGFTMYQHPWASHPRRTLIECFPNEVLWSAGVLGHADKLTEASLRAYKRIGKGRVTLPADAFVSLCRHTLFAAFRTVSLEPAVCERWFTAFIERLRLDKVVTDNPAEGRSGKAFDDCVDSVLSLTTAVAFVEGIAHVHQGHDPSDGHIIGPGLPTE